MKVLLAFKGASQVNKLTCCVAVSVTCFACASFGQDVCETAKLLSSIGQTGDRFGYSMSMDGTTLIVGNTAGGGGPPGEYVVVFQKDQDSSWIEVAIISGFQEGSNFGEAIAISGDLVVVGASNQGHECPPDCDVPGAAYIYSRNQGGPNNWGQLVEIPPILPFCDCQFGFSVSIDGDTVVIGSSGAGYVFQQNQGGPDNWGLVATIAPPEPSNTAGSAIAISGDTVAMNCVGGCGVLFLFERDEGGTDNWGFTSFVHAELGSRKSMALDGDVLIVGISQDNEHANLAGAALVFERNQGGPNNWGQVVKLTAPEPVELDQFGSSVAIDGDFVAVGAAGSQPGGQPAVGSVHVFNRHLGGIDNWGHFAKLAGGSDTEPDDGVGLSVSVSGQMLAFGAKYDTNENGGLAGSAYVFEIGEPDCNQNAVCDPVDIARGTSPDTNGNGIPDECECPPGDIDGDGFIGIPDLLLLLAQWGPCPPICLGDIDGDGVVAVPDLLTLLAVWGPCP